MTEDRELGRAAELHQEEEGCLSACWESGKLGNFCADWDCAKGDTCLLGSLIMYFSYLFTGGRPRILF